jgi:hypothetical protein
LELLRSTELNLDLEDLDLDSSSKASAAFEVCSAVEQIPRRFKEIAAVPNNLAAAITSAYVSPLKKKKKSKSILMGCVV